MNHVPSGSPAPCLRAAAGPVAQTQRRQSRLAFPEGLARRRAVLASPCVNIPPALALALERSFFTQRVRLPVHSESVGFPLRWCISLSSSLKCRDKIREARASWWSSSLRAVRTNVALVFSLRRGCTGEFERPWRVR